MYKAWEYPPLFGESLYPRIHWMGWGQSKPGPLKPVTPVSLMHPCSPPSFPPPSLLPSSVSPSLSLSLVGTSISPDREHLLRGQVATKMSQGSLYAGNGQVTTLDPEWASCSFTVRETEWAGCSFTVRETEWASCSFTVREKCCAEFHKVCDRGGPLIQWRSQDEQVTRIQHGHIHCMRNTHLLGELGHVPTRKFFLFFFFTLWDCFWGCFWPRISFFQSYLYAHFTSTWKWLHTSLTLAFHIYYQDNSEFSVGTGLGMPGYSYTTAWILLRF